MTLEQEFHERMLDIYRIAKRDLSYNATRFLQMVTDQGGVAAARQLISGSASDGFTHALGARSARPLCRSARPATGVRGSLL